MVRGAWKWASRELNRDTVEPNLTCGYFWVIVRDHGRSPFRLDQYRRSYEITNERDNGVGKPLHGRVAENSTCYRDNRPKTRNMSRTTRSNTTVNMDVSELAQGYSRTVMATRRRRASVHCTNSSCCVRYLKQRSTHSGRRVCTWSSGNNEHGRQPTCQLQRPYEKQLLLTCPLDDPIVSSPDNVAFFDNNSHALALDHPVVGDQHKNEHGREPTSGFRRQAKVPAGFLVRYQGGAANLLWMFRCNPALA